MFKWLRKRQEKEILKLVILNRRASEFLLMYYKDGSRPSFYPYLEQVNAQAGSLTIIGRRLSKMPNGQITEWLKINKDLRRFYDDTNTVFFKKFDQQFTPLEGWDQYIEREFGEE